MTRPRIPPSRRRLLERVGYGTLEMFARKVGCTVEDVREHLRSLDEWEIDGQRVFLRDRHLWFEPKGTGPDDCEMVRLVLEQSQHTLINARGGAEQS